MHLRLFLLATLLVAFLAVQPARAAQNEFLLGIDSAMVEYQVTSTGRNPETGTDTLWVADKGRKSARLQQRFKRSGKLDSETLGLVVDGWIYSIDLQKKTGMKMSLKQAQDIAKRYGKGADGQAFVKDFIQKNGGKILPSEEFLGRMCDVFEIWGMRTWAFNGVQLKTEGTIMGTKTSTVATKFDENPSIPASRFEIPAGVKIEEMPDIGAMLGGLMGGGQPPAGDEPAPSRQPAKPAPRKPVVQDEGAEAPPPPPTAPKPMVVKKPAPKPAPKTESASVRLSSEEFSEIAAKLHMAGHTTMAPESEGGGHTVNLIDTRGGAMGVTVLPLKIAEGLEQSASLKVDAKFDHQGHAAIAGVLADPNEGDSAVVLVRYPERKLALLVSSTPVKPKEELVKLLEQIDL